MSVAAYLGDMGRTAKHFHPYRLEPETGLLYRGRERVPLSRKSVAVLRCLLEKAGRVLSKEELLRAVWPDTFVVEENLKVHVLEIRKALGDDVRNPLFIETLHGRGYRFIAPVSDEPAPREAEGVPPLAALRPVGA
jgi:DNA-binding winged helix-turn-helix (wHTH) protein